MCLTLVDEVDYSKDIGQLKDIKDKEQLSHKVDWKAVKRPSRTQSQYLASLSLYTSAFFFSSFL